MEILAINLFSTKSARVTEFDAKKVIFFQFNVFGRNIKETTLERYFTEKINDNDLSGFTFVKKRFCNIFLVTFIMFKPVEVEKCIEYMRQKSNDAAEVIRPTM